PIVRSTSPRCCRPCGCPRSSCTAPATRPSQSRRRKCSPRGFRGRFVELEGNDHIPWFGDADALLDEIEEFLTGCRHAAEPNRAGVHTGECELIGEDVGGMAVHIGARVAAQAAPSEVLVSSTVKDLVVGSGIEFADRGSHELKGVPGDWRLLAVADHRPTASK